MLSDEEKRELQDFPFLHKSLFTEASNTMYVGPNFHLKIFALLCFLSYWTLSLYTPNWEFRNLGIVSDVSLYDKI